MLNHTELAQLAQLIANQTNSRESLEQLVATEADAYNLDETQTALLRRAALRLAGYSVRGS